MEDGRALGRIFGSWGRQPGMPDDRSNVRVIPLNSRTMNYVVGKIDEVWNNPNVKVRVEKVGSVRDGGSGDAQGRSASERPATESRPVNEPQSPATAVAARRAR